MLTNSQQNQSRRVGDDCACAARVEFKAAEECGASQKKTTRSPVLMCCQMRPNVTKKQAGMIAGALLLELFFGYVGANWSVRHSFWVVVWQREEDGKRRASCDKLNCLFSDTKAYQQ